MAQAVPIQGLKQYLHGLTPEARTLLAAELERARARGEEPPGATLILEELRSDAYHTGGKAPRPSDPQRLFFAPLEPFLVDDAPVRKHRGRISRACLDPLWEWICRDLAPQEAKGYVAQVTILLGADQRKAVEPVVRAFQDHCELRMRETLSLVAGDDKARRKLAFQIGTPNAVEDLRETATILRVRDAIALIAARLPASIGNLADEQLANVRALLESPVGRHRDIFLHALLMVMSRLGSPWQLIRLAIAAAGTDAAARVAETQCAVAVEIVLADIERMITRLREDLKACSGEEIASALKDIHDSIRTVRTEMDLSGDTPWSRQLAGLRAEVARLLQAEIEMLPSQVRRVLRLRAAKDVRPGSTIDASDVAEIEAKLVLAAACRNYAGELAISEATRRVHSDLQNYFDTGTQILLDRLRAAPPAERPLCQAQVDAAVRFCAKLFGSDYATTLAKAADKAARGDKKVMRA